MIKITDIKTFVTCPDKDIHGKGVNLVIVKVETNQDGLYGLGCATYSPRCLSVVTFLEKHLKPLLIGRDPRDTQDLWMLCYTHGYYRNGPVSNVAVGGIDMALWDIKGKIANLPVYQLLGGKSREALAIYRYATGVTKEDVLEKAQALWETC